MAFINALKQVFQNAWVRWIGFRYLRSKKNSKFLSFITLISIFGVGLGVTAMIVVLSVMEGFERELKKRLMGSDLHVLITPTRKVEGFNQGFFPAESIDLNQLSQKYKDKIKEIVPILSTEVILKMGRKVSGVILKGVSTERLKELRSKVSESIDPKLLVQKEGGEAITLPSVLIGQELATDIGVIPGDKILIVSPTETEGPFSAVPRVKSFVVEGIYQSGLPEQEYQTVFTEAQAVRSFLRRARVLSSFEITVHRFDEAPELAQHLKESLPTFKVKDWRELNSQLFASLKLERIAMFVMLAFIILVASFNIVTTLTLMVIEKKREISILRAMGARIVDVAGVFLAEGLLIGFLGICGGVLLGYGVCEFLQHYEIIALPEIYYDRTLPVSLNPMYFVTIPLAALLIVLGACIYPSKQAAEMNPLDGIRLG